MSKKIAFVLENFGVGGVTEVVKNIIDSLDGKDFQIELIVLTKIRAKKELAGVNYTYFDIKEDTDYSMKRYLQYAFIKTLSMKKYRPVVTFLNELEPDIVHFHTNPRQLMLGHCLKAALRSRMVYTDHLLRLGDNESTPLKRKILSYAHKRYYSLFDVTAVSAPVFENHLKYDLVVKTKAHELIENKIKPLSKSPNKLHTPKVRFIYIARVSRVKGHQTLLRAWSLVRSNLKRELILIGPNEAKLDSDDETVKFLGPLHKKEVERWIQQSDFGVFPSSKEGLPLALIEMLSSGLPVIVNDIPELTTIVKDHKLIYELDNEQDLANKIEFLLTNLHVREKFSKKALDSVSNYVSIRPGEKYVELYHKYTRGVS